MTVLASVQTAADAAPITWRYLLGAVAAAAAFIAPFLLIAYLNSPFHRRGVARLRAHRNAHQRGAARVHRH